MANLDNQNETLNNEEEVTDTIILTDEDGVEEEYRILYIHTDEESGNVYYAIQPVAPKKEFLRSLELPEEIEESGERFLLLREEVDEEDNIDLITIDDDEEYDEVYSIIDGILFGEIDYDAE